MKKSIQNTAALAMALLMLAGCARTAPVYNVEGDTAPAAIQGKTASTKIGQTIAGAVRDSDWKIVSDKPGKIRAKTAWHVHEATIDITYTDASYDITLVDSVNLMANNGVIHRNYNKRVAALQKLIDERLAGN